MIMPFGKYRGKELELVPSGYFSWLLEQDWVYQKRNDELLDAIDYEMAVRDRSDGHFYEDEG